MNSISEKIALKALEMEAIKLNVKEPFTWASGYKMPIYNDNRRLLADSSVRSLVAEGFATLIEQYKLKFDEIAGTATAGIPHATTLADLLEKPLSYVRSSEKGHGLKNLIEGLDSSGSYKQSKVLLIEDLISTGGSSIKAINAIRDADGIVDTILAIFTYNLPASVDNFNKLEPKCTLYTLLDYDQLVATALRTGYVNKEEEALLKEWKTDPFGWGDKHL